MMISTRGRYALRVLVYLAEQDSSRFIPLKEIAEQEEISEKYLESIVKTLVKVGYLEGLRGKGGGYRLGQSAEDINVLDVLQVMEETMTPVSCLEAGGKSCARAGNCRTLPLWKGLHEVVTGYLRGYTIHDLAKGGGDFDYVI